MKNDGKMKTEWRDGYKKPTKRSRWFVPPEIWSNAITFCRCYPLWKAEMSVCDTTRTITDYTRDKVQTSNIGSPTEQLAIRRAKLSEKIAIVENAAAAVSDGEIMQKFIIIGVTHHLSYETLQKQGIPCGRRMYHELRREMIYRVSQEI